MRHIVQSLGILGLALLAGCGGGRSPTGPSSGPQSVHILDGRTEQSVPSLAGREALTGETMHLTAPGFLSLSTVFRGSTILLWPNDAALPVATTRALAYQDKDSQVLVRWPDGTRLNLVLDAPLRSSPWVVTRTENAAAVVSRVHPAIHADVAGAGTSVPVTLDPGDGGFITHPNAAMVAYVRYGDSGVASEARIVVRSVDLDGFWHGEQNFQTAMVHEIIHTTGLVGHLPSGVKGTMSANADIYGFPEPTPSEVLVMKMQYARLVGTILTGETENEGGRVTTSSGQGTWHLVCAR